MNLNALPGLFACAVTECSLTFYFTHQLPGNPEDAAGGYLPFSILAQLYKIASLEGEHFCEGVQKAVDFFHNGCFPSLLAESRKELFLNTYYENLLEHLEIKLIKVCGCHHSWASRSFYLLS